jgi:cytochrome o ubiquinol oxidase operon protein cyoD
MKNREHGYSFRAYLTGFILCVALTLIAYYSVVENKFSGNALLIWIGWLAIIQFFVQMVLFLHLGRETKPRWKQTVFWFMTMVVVILVFGSIWIMNNLNYHHADMTLPSDKSIIEDEGYKP